MISLLRRFGVLASVVMIACGVVLAPPAQAASSTSAPTWQAAEQLGSGLGPVIKTDSRGRAHAVWRSWDSDREDGQLLYAYRDAPGDPWSKPRVLTTTNAQRVSSDTFALVVGQHGEVAVVWAPSPKFTSAKGLYLRWSTDRGTTWSAATRLRPGADASIDQVAAGIDSKGRITIAWNGEYSSGNLTGLLMTPPTPLGTTPHFSMVDRSVDLFDLQVAPDGRALVAWDRLGEATVRVRSASGVWTKATRVSSSDWTFSLLAFPSGVFLDDGSMAVVWSGYVSRYSDGSATSAVWVARQDARTKKWTRTTLGTIKPDMNYDFEPVIAAEGQNVVVAATFPGTSGGDRVKLWHSRDTGKSWPAPVTVATTAVGNPRISLAPDGTVLAAWLEKRGNARAAAARFISPAGTMSPRTVIATVTDEMESKGFWPKDPGPSIALLPRGSAVFVWSDGDHVRSRLALPPGPFPDVTLENVHYPNIVWLKSTGITIPADGLFHPSEAVTRGQMAMFLFRLLNPGRAAPTCTAKPFDDVARSNIFCGAIAWAARTGVTKGVAGTHRFDPDGKVTRGQMSAFLKRIGTTAATPVCRKPPFRDVPVSSTFCGSILWMSRHGITSGVGDGTNFAPDTVVTRDQMASFLHRISDYRNR